MASNEAIRADIVFCKDVVHHQTDPKKLLSALYEKANNYLILRVRTREVGPTVFDPSQSCQFLYGDWVPYIVFNSAELAELIRSYQPSPVRIALWRHPVVLGGAGGRYLPKELYDPQTGTAETAVLIEKRSGSSEAETQVEVITRPETRGLARPLWLRSIVSLAKRVGV